MAQSRPRYLFVDALRGLACLGVLLAHLSTERVAGVLPRDRLPVSLVAIADWGHFGVEIFFVLSGYAIALSMTQNPLTWSRAARFILRRELRLTPPYWVATAAIIAVGALQGHKFPSLSNLALNLVYLHNLVGVPQILGVAWTLCLELQFYAAFLVVLALNRLGSRETPVSLFAAMVVLVTGLVSMTLAQVSTPWQLYVYGHCSWFYFGLGVLCYWCGRGWVPSWSFGIYVVAMALSGLWGFTRSASFVSISFQGVESGVATALVLWVARERGFLETLSFGPLGSWLGRISYSLYLVHGPALGLCAWLAERLWGATPLALWLSFGCGIPVALMVAWGFYLIVERPSLQWAARYKQV